MTSSSKKWVNYALIFAALYGIWGIVNLFVTPNSTGLFNMHTGDAQTDAIFKTAVLAGFIVGVLFVLIEFLLVFFAHRSISRDKNGAFGWSIFLLIIGIFHLVGVLAGIFTIGKAFSPGAFVGLLNLLGLLLELGAGLTYLLTFVSKNKERQQ